MAKKYELLPNEKIILKATNVRHGFWGAYTNELLLTNEALISVELGMFGNYKRSIRYPLYDISQVIKGKATNGVDQLEVYHSEGHEEFGFLSQSEAELRTWVLAINDKLSGREDGFDNRFYQDLMEDARIDEYKEKYVNDDHDYTETAENSAGLGIDTDNIAGLGIGVGDIAKSLLKSGGSTKKLAKELKKTTSKRRNSGFMAELKQGLKSELGFDEVEDEFIEIGNEFREAFGLKPKMTNQMKKEIAEKEKQRRENAAYERRVAEARRNAAVNADNKQKQEAQSVNIDAQIETLKKLKELLDAGILTQEEFDSKKRQILEQ